MKKGKNEKHDFQSLAGWDEHNTSGSPVPHKCHACHAECTSMSPSAEPAQCHKCHACLAKWTWRSPSAMLLRLPRKVKVDVTKCHACHANSRGDHGVKREPRAPPEPACLDVAKCHPCSAKREPSAQWAQELHPACLTCSEKLSRPRLCILA